MDIDRYRTIPKGGHSRSPIHLDTTRQMLRAIFWDQMKLTVNLTVKIFVATITSIGDNGSQMPLTIEWE
jgi:hypothetical protein